MATAHRLTALPQMKTPLSEPYSLHWPLRGDPSWLASTVPGVLLVITLPVYLVWAAVPVF